jgi:hypothetical protein
VIIQGRLRCINSAEGEETFGCRSVPNGGAVDIVSVYHSEATRQENFFQYGQFLEFGWDFSNPHGISQSKRRLTVGFQRIKAGYTHTTVCSFTVKRCGRRME